MIGQWFRVLLVPSIGGACKEALNQGIGNNCVALTSVWGVVWGVAWGVAITLFALEIRDIWGVAWGVVWGVAWGVPIIPISGQNSPEIRTGMNLRVFLYRKPTKPCNPMIQL